MKARVRFIINPISGVGRKGAIPELIATYLDLEKFDYDIVYTEFRGHASEIARVSAADKVDIVCAVGGDGTVHEVGTALIGTKTKLAIVPAGSGNGLARHLNIPLVIEKAIENINEMHILHMDTVLVNDKPFLNAGGYGFDALIAKKFDEGKKRGFLAYIKLVISEFFKYNPVNVSVDVNGQVKSMPVVMCSIANASEFGNGFCLSPKSDVTDGKIELVLLKPFRFWALPRLAFQFFRKRAHKSRFAEIISFEKAKIRLSKRIAHYDGEPFDVKNELHVQVVPKSLLILSGRK
ncbi:MAG: diacylglycerol kinase family lipid kinase [Crocinitomicaceae bacterium]|nr:diacylglycerol kinase family lipid kinase [Crocinitomicaceae bacterium]